jgi:hypothetical protein
MKTTSEKIRELISATKPQLLKIPSEVTSKRPSPNTWSKKEIVGHLIDSASNNHQRFVRGAQNLAGDFPTYNQNRWVEVQHYGEMDWIDLIEFFSHYNLHLCRVIDSLPREALSNRCNIGKENPVTLEFVIEDYLRHLTHHTTQILASPT